MDVSDVEGVEEGEEFFHVRFREAKAFEEVRTPDWAQDAAGAVATEARVRTGHDGDDWAVQSVLVPTSAGVETARNQAVEIAERVES